MRRGLQCAALAAAWLGLSAALSPASPTPAAVASLLSTLLLAAGAATGARPLLALAVLAQLPALVSLSLRGSPMLAALAMLATLYLAELADLPARARRSLDRGYVREAAKRVSAVAALSAAVTVGAMLAFERLAPTFDVRVAAALALALALLATHWARGLGGE